MYEFLKNEPLLRPPPRIRNLVETEDSVISSFPPPSSLTTYKMPAVTLISLCVRRVEVILLTNLIIKWGEIWARRAYFPISQNFSAASLEIHQVVAFVYDYSIFPPCLSQLFSVTKILEGIEKDLERACTRSRFVSPTPSFSQSFSSARAFARLYQSCKCGFLSWDRSEFPRVSVCPYVLSAFGSPFPEADHSPLLCGCVCAQC